MALSLFPSAISSIFKPASKQSKSGYDPLSNNNQSGWALAKFYFEVDFGANINIGFQACDGLQASVEPYEFRDGNSSEFHKQKRPGTVVYDPVTFKKGMFANDMGLYNWFKNVSTGMFFADMRTVKVRLKDENDTTVYTWTLNKAFVTRYTPTTMDAEAGEEVAIEEIEIQCQYWTMDSSGVGSLLSRLL